VLILTNLVSIVSELKDLDGIIYLKAVQARMAKIFNDFHFQIFVQIFVFNSWPKKQHSLYKKSAGKLSRCQKKWGWDLFHLTRPLDRSEKLWFLSIKESISYAFAFISPTLLRQ
jgi:hypothetical protein